MVKTKNCFSHPVIASGLVAFNKRLPGLFDYKCKKTTTICSIYFKNSYPDFTVKQHTNRGALDYSWEFKAFKTLMSTSKNNLISI